MSFEKVPEASWSGTSTKAGQILLIKLNAVDASATGAAGNGLAVGSMADTMFITLMSENILEIRDVACSIYD